MNGLQRRMGTLERESGQGEIHVIAIRDGHDGTKGLRDVGIQPKPEDLVVFVRRFDSDEPPAVVGQGISLT